jgi:hypothetical protein
MYAYYLPDCLQEGHLAKMQVASLVDPPLRRAGGLPPVLVQAKS